MIVDHVDQGDVTTARVCGLLEGIERTRADWLELTKIRESPVLFQSPDYLYSYAKIFQADGESDRLVTLCRGDEIVALFPLRRINKRQFGLTLRLIKFSDTPIIRCDAILSPAISAGEALDILRRQLNHKVRMAWDVIALNGVPEESRLVTEESAKKTFLRLMRQADQNNYLDLSRGNYLEDNVAGKLRNNLKRSRTRLSSIGEVEFATIDSFPALSQAFNDFLEVEASGWKSRRGGRRAIKLHEDQTSFYLDLMEQFSKTGDCHIHLLKLDGKVIAANFALRINKTFFSLKSGYDESLPNIAPGQILREYVINLYSADPSVEYYDLLSNYSWQAQWRPKRRRIYDIFFFNKTFIGLLAYFSFRVKFLMRKERNWDAEPRQ